MAVIRKNATEADPVEIIVHFVKMCDGSNGEKFPTFKVEVGNKLVDLRWKKDVNVHEFAGLKKFKVTVKEFSEGTGFVYPRYYAGGIVGDIIEM